MTLPQVLSFGLIGFRPTYNPDHRTYGFNLGLRQFPPGWYYSSLLGLSSVTEWALQNGTIIGHTVGCYDTALQAASGEGHLAIVQYILENNFAEVNEAGIGLCDTALDAVSFDRHSQLGN